MVTMQVLPNREDWLKHRTKIGGSDASAILGKNPYKTNVELWKDKAFHLMPEDISDKPYVKYGIQAEPHLRALFSLDFPEKKSFLRRKQYVDK
jgi:predicted phage-related endonuclease